MMRSYAVIWCGDFKLQAVIRKTRRTIPVALVDDTQRQSVILARNAIAAAQGVEIGMPTVQALGRSAGLQVERPSDAAELAAGRYLIETALGWVPLIEETAPGILTLDLSSQPDEQWHENALRIHGELATSGLDVAIGIGETPSLARIASQAALFRSEPVWHLHPDQRLAQLDRLPLTMAEVALDLSEKLELWGIFTLGAFARLRREAIASRLADEGVELWLRLTGRLQRPLHAAQLEALFEEAHDFEYEVHQREPLLFILHRFVESLVERVTRTNRVAVAVHFLLLHTDGHCYARRLRLPEPTLDEALIHRVLSGHLETVEMNAPVCELRIRFEVSEALSSQRTLFGAGLKNFFQYNETLKRLRGVVGVDRIGSPRSRADHRVDRFEIVSLPKEICEFARKNTGAPPPETGLVFRRYRTPRRVNVTLRDGVPLMVESTALTGIITRKYGPWKSTGQWWHQSDSWDRAEWDVELMNKGVFRVVEAGGGDAAAGWFVEGYYD